MEEKFKMIDAIKELGEQTVKRELEFQKRLVNCLIVTIVFFLETEMLNFEQKINCKYLLDKKVIY